MYSIQLLSPLSWSTYALCFLVLLSILFYLLSLCFNLPCFSPAVWPSSLQSVLFNWSLSQESWWGGMGQKNKITLLPIFIFYFFDQFLFSFAGHIPFLFMIEIKLCKLWCHLTCMDRWLCINCMYIRPVWVIRLSSLIKPSPKHILTILFAFV